MMGWKSGLVLTWVLALPLPALAQDSEPKTLEQITPEIDALFARFKAEAHVPGIVYGVVRDS